MTLWHSTALRQGLLSILVALASLVLMAILTLGLVAWELREATDNPLTILNGQTLIEVEELLEIILDSFLLSGCLVLMVMVPLILYLSLHNQKRIISLERLLARVATGDLTPSNHGVRGQDDLARLAQSVDTMVVQLRQSLAAMKDISSNIAHELKTPISRLHSHLQIWQQTQDPNEASRAMAEVAHLTQLFDALLRISQIESGSQRARFQSINLIPLMHTLEEMYQDLVEDSGHHWQLDVPNGEVWIQGDRALLIQLGANLIENALRYCPTGSQIQLSLRLLGQDAIFFVADNGPGIEAAHRSRVCERLYRVHPDRHPQGLGLGLALVKAIAQLHQGDLQLLDNQPGLRVELRLPLI